MSSGEPQRAALNMYETLGAMVLVLALPGVMAEDVTIEVDGPQVQVTAAQRTPAEKDYILHEWHYGPYTRAVEIPEGFAGPAFATFGNGQLAVHLARGEGRDGKVTFQPTAAGHPSP